MDSSVFIVKVSPKIEKQEGSERKRGEKECFK
jgi:hypothetical protein